MVVSVRLFREWPPASCPRVLPAVDAIMSFCHFVCGTVYDVVLCVCYSIESDLQDTMIVVCRFFCQVLFVRPEHRSGDWEHEPLGGLLQWRRPHLSQGLRFERLGYVHRTAGNGDLASHRGMLVGVHCCQQAIRYAWAQVRPGDFLRWFSNRLTRCTCTVP